MENKSYISSSAVQKYLLLILNMQALILFLFALCTPLVMCYDEKYDKLDVDKILADEGLFSSYVQCLLGKGDCTVEHSGEIKDLMPEVVATACAKCTPTQRVNLRKSVNAVQERNPKDFEEFRKKYDPKGEYEEAFAVFMVSTN